MTNASDLESLLGEVDAGYLERILETGATFDEAAEALSIVEAEQETGERREPSSARVAAVRAILDDMFEGERDDAGASAGAP